MVIYQKRIYRADLRANPDVMYLFGDNVERVGYGGQAKEMRGAPNAIGIATKKAPGMREKDFFTDDELEENKHIIEEDMARAFNAVANGRIVVVPGDGLGTGLSELPERAPLTNDYLLLQLRRLRG